MWLKSWICCMEKGFETFPKLNEFWCCVFFWKWSAQRMDLWLLWKRCEGAHHDTSPAGALDLPWKRSSSSTRKVRNIQYDHRSLPIMEYSGNDKLVVTIISYYANRQESCSYAFPIIGKLQPQRLIFCLRYEIIGPSPVGHRKWSKIENLCTTSTKYSQLGL